MRWPLVAVPAVLAGFTALTACSPGASVITPADAPQTSPGVITVTANDDACQLSRTETLAGRVIFDVRNAGREVTEFYVYDKNSYILGEAENIRAGQSRRSSLRSRPVTSSGPRRCTRRRVPRGSASSRSRRSSVSSTPESMHGRTM
jgi:hypothetical protein